MLNPRDQDAVAGERGSSPPSNGQAPAADEGRAVSTSPQATVVFTEAGGNTFVSVETAGATTAPFSPDSGRLRPGTVFGSYTLLDEIGSGGMGVVYKAKQANPGREVAIKLIKAAGPISADQLRRFQNEIESLARLDHESIVPIYEVGRLDSVPFFSMKLIDGESLSEHLVDCKGDFRRIARLGSVVARAIGHAHKRGVLHRDVKPANILIDRQGRPHVTDFGLAKQLEVEGLGSPEGFAGEATGVDMIVGTPSYMSPEQASFGREELTTATDVYGIGGLLYAMLTGRPPFRGPSRESVLEKVRQEPPEPPSKLNSAVPRDLETICLHCLEKSPAQRYGSAEALADDLDHWLRGEPIHARPISPATRVWMWCRRKPALAGLTAALAASIIVGVAGIVWNWMEVRQQRALLFAKNHDLEVANRQTLAESQTTAVVNRFYSDLLIQASPASNGGLGFGNGDWREVTVVELLDHAAASVGRDFGARPKIEAAIRRVLGESYRSLGKRNAAAEQLDRAVEICDKLPAEDKVDRLAAIHSLAQLRVDQSRGKDAEDLARAELEGRRQLGGPGDVATLEAAALLAVALRVEGKLDAAEALLKETYETSCGVLPPESPSLLSMRCNLAAIAYDRRHWAEAEQAYRDVLALVRRNWPEDHPQTLIIKSSLGAALVHLNRDGEAEPILKTAYDDAARILKPSHPLTLSIGTNLASVYLKDRPQDAEPLLKQILASHLEAAEPDVAQTVTVLNNLAFTLRKLKRGDEVLAYFRQSRRYSDKLPIENPLRLTADLNLAGMLVDRGETKEAVEIAAVWFTKDREAVARSSPLFGELKGVYGRALLAQGRAADAERWLLQYANEKSARPGASAWQSAFARACYARCRLELKKDDEAERLLDRASRELLADPRTPPRLLVEALGSLIKHYDLTGRPALAPDLRAGRDAAAKRVAEQTKP